MLYTTSLRQSCAVHFCTVNFKWSYFIKSYYLVSIYLLDVNNRTTRTRCEIYSKLTVKTLERHRWRLSDVFIVNFEHVLRLVLVFLLVALNEIRINRIDSGFPMNLWNIFCKARMSSCFSEYFLRISKVTTLQYLVPTKRSYILKPAPESCYLFKYVRPFSGRKGLKE